MEIKEFFLNDRFAVTSGIELLEVRPGYAKTRMAIEERHLNAGKVVQGGAIFTLADLAFAAAANAYGTLTVSAETSIRYFKGETSGLLTAEAREVSMTRHLATFQVEVRNDAGVLIALFTATGYRKDTPLPFVSE